MLWNKLKVVMVVALLAAFASRMEGAGYGLAHTPIFEDVRVFRRGIGEASDVVGKEMYEFEDRGGRALALRWGKYVFLTEERLNKAEDFFDRRGAIVI